jgi:signal transduction histidine kinase
MNNPLTVISGRSQLLASTLTDPSSKAMAEQIRDQSHRISDMITALRTFAEPNKPEIRAVNLAQLLDAAVRDVCARYDESRWTGEIKVVVEQGLADAHVDPEQIARALNELLRNAIESESCTQVEVRVQIDPVNDRLMISVTDNGGGLTPHAMAHAFDPFFSCKPAGRQPGLGLAQARRLVEAHGGQITLENNKSPTARGAVATIRLNQWRGPVLQQRGAA